MANEKTPVVWDDDTKKHRPLGTGEKMGGLDASSILSSDSGNLIQTGSDGLAYLSGGSIADPRADNLLEESANGKLQVTADRIVEWLGLNPSDAEKIAEALAAKMAGELADGQTITASSGKLHSDPTHATVAQKKAINQALADASSGLVVDPSTGKLTVDFSQMPTDKFEALLAGLKMQVPLSANLSLHVDNSSDAAGDDIVDGRGTAAKPFRTIRACVTWATGYYSLGEYNVSIYVHTGSSPYSESVVLPSYNATSGRFSILASDSANPPTIVCPSNVGTNMSCSGGRWRLQRLRFINNPSVVGLTGSGFPRCLTAIGSNASVSVLGCEFDFSYYGSATTSLFSVVIGAESGATISFYPMSTYPTTLTYHKGNSSWLRVLYAISDSTINFYRSSSSSEVFPVECQGDCSYFAESTTDSGMSVVGSGSDCIHFVVASGQTCTGSTYSVTNGSFIRAPYGGFPGTAASGSVESETYCWYKEAAS